MVQGGQRTILARDADGAEHRLKVIAHAGGGLISIRDSVYVRFLAPPDALELVMALVEALGEQADPPPGAGAIAVRGLRKAAPPS